MSITFEHPLVYTVLCRKPPVQEDSDYDYRTVEDSENYVFITHNIEDLIVTIEGWLIKYFDYLTVKGRSAWIDCVYLLVNGYPVSERYSSEIVDDVDDYSERSEELDKIMSGLIKVINDELVIRIDNKIELARKAKEAKLEAEKQLKLEQEEQRRQSAAKQELETFLKLKEKFEGKGMNPNDQ